MVQEIRLAIAQVDDARLDITGCVNFAELLERRVVRP